jgi:hypothetical protein
LVLLTLLSNVGENYKGIRTLKNRDVGGYLGRYFFLNGANSIQAFTGI